MVLDLHNKNNCPIIALLVMKCNVLWDTVKHALCRIFTANKHTLLQQRQTDVLYKNLQRIVLYLFLFTAGSGERNYGGYDNLDVETASPHKSVDNQSWSAAATTFLFK